MRFDSDSVANYILKLENRSKSFLKKHPYLLGASVVICITCAYLYLHYSISKYQVDCVIEVQKNDKSDLTNAEIDREIKKITSESLIRQAVRQQAFKPGVYDVTNDNTDSLAKIYGNNIEVTTGSEPNTLTISVIDKDAQRGQAFLKDLIMRYKYSYLNIDQRKLNQARLINDSLNILSATLANVTRRTNYSDIPVRVAVNNSKPVNRGELQRQLKALQVILFYINKGGSFVLIPDTYIPRNNILSQLIIQFNALQLKKQSVLSSQPGQAEVAKVTQQLVGVQNQMKSEISLEDAMLNKVLQSAPHAVFVNYTKPLNVKSKTADEIKIRTMIARLKLRSTHLLTGAQSLPAQNITITDYNVTPVQPEAPIFYLGAIILGLILPSSALYTWQKTHKVIRSAADAEAATDIEMAGEMPDESHGASADNGSATSVAERSYKTIAASILTKLNEGQKVITITSATEGEGKTHCILKLAEVLSVSNRVVVVDYNLENPHIPEKIDLPYLAGLNNFLVHDNIPISKLLTPSAQNKNLFFIGAATTGKDIRDKMKNFFNRIAEEPDQEHLPLLYQEEANTRFKSLLSQLKKQFDYILIYVPTQHLLPNSQLLGQLADISVLVVRYHYTTKDQLAVFNRLLKEKVVKNAVVVGNRLRSLSNNLTL